MIYPSNLNFLVTLSNNNNREWFNANKAEFEKEQANVVAFAEKILVNLNKHDVIETPSGKRSLYRIYRDVRFSKDKTPYQTYWGGGFRRASKFRRGGYYFHLEKGNSLLAGGFWGPNARDLKRIREEIALDDHTLREIISTTTFIQNFGKLAGNQLKIAPKGFDPNHAAIDLLKYKQFLLIKRFTDVEVLNDDFVEKVDDTFKAMLPFFNYMSNVLTTDLNGEEI
ncbi:DUF2461 domain-containing protein [Pedobacter sp. Du54]|uniref:DUF2461 domain-containing protein n=1 Tax=Pedobacter anseongensis TaxID=3133439 RepID=UPI0030B24DF0